MFLSFRRTFGYFWSFIIKYKRRFILFSTLLVTLGILESLQPLFYRQFVDVLPEGKGR